MTNRKNVFIIVADTARYDDAYSRDPLMMPTLGDIATGGTRYSNAFSNAPWTLPSHAGLFTGTYSSDHGAHGDHPHLDEELTTLAEVYHQAGYETWAASNNTWISPEFGFDSGFSTFWKGWQFLQSEHDVGSILHESGPSKRAKAALQSMGVGNPIVNAINAAITHLTRSQGDYGARRTTKRIQSWITKRDAERPFFAFVNYLEPHIQYAPPSEFAEPFLPTWATYDEAMDVRQDPRAFDAGQYRLSSRELRLLRALYRGELAFVDAQLGKIRSTLKEIEEWENTIFIVLGDHGENIGDHGFLGHQYNLYDTLIHVPLVIAGGPFDGGVQNDNLVQLPDIGPTLLDVLDIEAPVFRAQARGQSFAPGANPPRDHIIAEYISPQPPISVLAERFTEIPAHCYAYDRSLRTIRTEDEKLIQGSDGHIEFYHVASDPTEHVDRADRSPERVEHLSNRLSAWLEGFDHAESSEEVEIAEATKDRLAQLGYM